MKTQHIANKQLRIEADTKFEPARTATVAEIVGKVITLRDDATGEGITANRAIFRHDETIAVGDRFTYELVSRMNTANRISKVEGQ